jgi:hypothetical protein
MERPIQVAEDFQCGLSGRLRHEPRDMPTISHEHDLLLLVLHGIEHLAEVPGNLRDGERLDGGSVSDWI